MTAKEIGEIAERAATEDWSFEQLAYAIGHGVECAKELSLAKYAGMPLKCKCSKGIE